MSFADSIKYGNLGELIVIDYFVHHKGIKEVFDVRDDKRFQNMDVDFLLMNLDRSVTWLEVKTDFRADETGNFVYECISSKYQNSIGCFEKTQSDIIGYYVPNSGKLYLINTNALKNYVRTHSLKEIQMGDNALGYLLEIGDLERTGVIVQEVDVLQYGKGNK